jgi:sporulation protein YlmC with PRC-barrel domain
VPAPRVDPEVSAHDGRTFRLSALIGTRVYTAGGKDLGRCHDVWAVADGPGLGAFGPALRIHSLLAGRGAFGERLGYHHGGVKGPWAFRALFQRMHRSAVVIAWDCIDVVEKGAIRLRAHANLGPLDEFNRDHTDGIFLGLRVLDSQIVDAQGLMTGNADDLELTASRRADRAPYVSAILTGPGALAHRLGGRLGLWLESVHRRLHPAENAGPAAIPFERVREIGNHVQLDVPRSKLDISGFEDWVRDRIIDKIPGSKGTGGR